MFTPSHIGAICSSLNQEWKLDIRWSTASLCQCCLWFSWREISLILDSLASMPIWSYTYIYLWGYGEQNAYSENNNRTFEIQEVVTSVTADVLCRVWKELEYHLDVCKGTHIACIQFQ